MNETLRALMHKLSWQLNEINQFLQEVENQQTKINDILTALQEQINKACAAAAILNPEQEIARLNFIMLQKQQYENLRVKYKDLELSHSQFLKRQIRLNAELKMLEKYQQKQQEKERHSDILLQQNTMDEWILQKRK